MSVDGADIGVTAEDGMKAAIGGEQPEKSLDPIEFEAYIMAQTGPSDYSGTAAYMAKLILVHLRAHPEDTRIPTERQYNEIRGSDGHLASLERREDVRNLSDVMDTYPEWRTAIDGATGFMWGWAVNAARRCCELPSVANPAIITIGGEA